ncbi:hypothetical protein [Cupriavidus pauculus]|uniref:hypothetical protein n=1 Tax=Cupriavidus pauculus TaxID=82633 RepID=UPI001D0C1B3D|nr:hypothetical protein [Cupriavidus pauculus]
MIVKHFSAVVVVFALTACCTQPKGKTQSEESDEKRLSTSVELIYVPEAGKTCSPSPGSQDGCVRQISSFQKKYWRLELDSVGSTGYVPPTIWQAAWSGLYKNETVIASTFYVRRANIAFEVPLAALKVTNTRQPYDTLPLRPTSVTPWFLGATDAMVDANVAAMTTLVQKDTSHFVDAARGALQVVSLFNPYTAVTLALPTTGRAFDALRAFETRMNEARGGSIPLTGQMYKIYPEYLTEITVYEQNFEPGTKKVLYRLKPVTRDSLFVQSISDSLTVANIQRIKVPAQAASTTGTATSHTNDVPLLALLSEQFNVPKTGEISYETCVGVLQKLAEYEYNDLDSAFIATAWLSTKEWDTSSSRRDAHDRCYQRIASSMVGTSFATQLLKSREELDRNNTPKEQLNRNKLMQTSKKVFDDLSNLLDGKSPGLSDTRFADMVTVSAIASTPELDAFFDSDLAKAPRVAFASELAELLATADKPIQQVTAPGKSCYQLLPNTVSSTVQARCFFVTRADGSKQRYSIILGLDRQLSDPNGGEARIISIQFQSPL